MTEAQLRKLQTPNRKHLLDKLTNKASLVGNHRFYWEILSLTFDSESQYAKHNTISRSHFVMAQIITSNTL